MNSVPSIPETGEARPVDLRHPSWCDVANSCTAPSALEARGVAEGDVPLYQRSVHRTTPVVVEVDEFSDTKIELYGWRWIYEPVTDVVQGVDVTLTLADRRAVFSATLTPSQIQPLAAALDGLRFLIERTSGAE